MKINNHEMFMPWITSIEYKLLKHMFREDLAKNIKPYFSNPIQSNEQKENK